MKKNFRSTFLPKLQILIITAVVAFGTCERALAYLDYGGCKTCHGDFRGPVSPKGIVFPSGNKHEMHRATTSMDADCNLCHKGSSRTPVYIASSNGTTANSGIGCIGCHEAAGLRAHHVASGVAECYDCHDPAASPPETVNPPYYGTIDTRVKNAANTILAANTNENWSVGDFIGLDNDGNNLYDLADYAVGPLKAVGVVKEGANVRISWLTAGGRKEVVQAAGSPSGAFTNVGGAVTVSGVGTATTNVLDLNAATNVTRYYRIKSVP